MGARGRGERRVGLEGGRGGWELDREGGSSIAREGGEEGGKFEGGGEEVGSSREGEEGGEEGRSLRDSERRVTRRRG